MKFKYYLRGCGFGILFTAIVLTVSFHTRGGVMTDEKAMERASELGMVMPDGTEDMSDTQEDTQTAKPVVNPLTQNTQKSTDSQAEDTQSKGQEKDKNKDKDKDKDKSEDKKPGSNDGNDEKKDEDDKTVTITVKSGEVCRELAEDLYDKGLVDDAEAFRKYMKDRGYDSKFRVGTFELKKGMTYAQIAKVLTTKPE